MSVALAPRFQEVLDPPSSRLAPLMAALASAILGVGAPAIVLALMAAREGIRSPWLLPVALATFLVAGVVMAMDLRYGLALFLVCAALSPKIPGLYDNLRVEDFVFVLVFGIWLFRTLHSGRLPVLKSALTPAYLVLAGVGLLSAIWGFSQGTMPDLKYSLLLQLKRLEYLLIFFVVRSTVRSQVWLQALTLLFVASGALAAGYGLIHAEEDQYQAVSGVARVQGPEGENYNTLSGYLIVCLSVGIGCAYTFRGVWRWLVIAASSVAGLGLLFTFSREGLVMLGGALAVFLFTRQRWVSWAAIVLLTVGLTLSPPLREHFVDTVTKIRDARTGSVSDNSLTARFRAWEHRLEKHFVKQPLLGTGAGSVGLSVDNEYILRLCEAGLVGLMAFLAWLYVVGKLLQRAARLRGLTHALGVGGLAAFAGLLIQGLAAASFTTIRTMEPFWFLLGLIGAALALDRELERKADEAEAPPPAAPSFNAA